MKEKILMLEVGESCAFDISKTTAVRATASNLGKENRRKYSTRTDEESGAVIVQRMS